MWQTAPCFILLLANHFLVLVSLLSQIYKCWLVLVEECDEGIFHYLLYIERRAWWKDFSELLDLASWSIKTTSFSRHAFSMQKAQMEYNLARLLWALKYSSFLSSCGIFQMRRFIVDAEFHPKSIAYYSQLTLCLSTYVSGVIFCSRWDHDKLFLFIDEIFWFHENDLLSEFHEFYLC